MKFSLSRILQGRPAVAYGAGEYFGRFCERTTDIFEYFVDDTLAGQSRGGVPIYPISHLARERRDICVFLFRRDLGTAILALSEYGLHWKKQVFDARAFGDGGHAYNDYTILSSKEDIAASPDIDLYEADGANWTQGKIVICKKIGERPAGIFLAEDAHLSTGDIILSSGSRLCCGRNAHVIIGERVSIPGHFHLNCSLGSSATIGNDVFFSPHTVLNTASYTSIKIGARSTIASHFDLYAYAPIEIGAGCMISSHVFIASGSGHDVKINSEARPPKKIILGEFVWIGWGTQVLAGAELGYGAMAAAGSIVTRSFPSGTLVAGVPARMIASEISWNRDFNAYKNLFYPKN